MVLALPTYPPPRLSPLLFSLALDSTRQEIEIFAIRIWCRRQAEGEGAKEAFKWQWRWWVVSI